MATPMDPPPNLGGPPPGYPARRTLPQPADNPGKYPAPPVNQAPFVPQMTSPPPPRPDVPLVSEANFQPEAIPGTSCKFLNSKNANPVER